MLLFVLARPINAAKRLFDHFWMRFPDENAINPGAARQVEFEEAEQLEAVSASEMRNEHLSFKVQEPLLIPRCHFISSVRCECRRSLPRLIMALRLSQCD